MKTLKLVKQVFYFARNSAFEEALLLIIKNPAAWGCLGAKGR